LNAKDNLRLAQDETVSWEPARHMVPIALSSLWENGLSVESAENVVRTDTLQFYRLVP